jgi:cytochrome c oxidase subunit 2
MNILYADSPINYSYGFQDPASQWMLGIISLHDFIIFYLIIIATVVLWINISIFFNADYLGQLAHGNLIELIWTITPAAILWIIGVPSLKLLYKMDEILDSEITVKAIGNQWFWSYEYSDYVTEEAETITFDSFLIPDADLNLGDLRTLTVDNYLVLPANTNIRVLCTSNDVIHSFAIPSLGIKADCYPGRLNSLGFVINRESYYYGGCSELCGSLHHAMPIGVNSVPLDSYLSFIKSSL